MRQTLLWYNTNGFAGAALCTPIDLTFCFRFSFLFYFLFDIILTSNLDLASLMKESMIRL